MIVLRSLIKLYSFANNRNWWSTIVMIIIKPHYVIACIHLIAKLLNFSSHAVNILWAGKLFVVTPDQPD